MEQFLSDTKQNPLKTREDLARALGAVCGAVRPYYSEGGARLRLGSSCAHYPSGIAEMEGFSRMLWGLVPLLAGGFSSDIWETCLMGIRHGTDPAHKEYWGDIGDYDQRMVEMAAFGFALALIPEKIWDPLSERERKNLAAWLGQINRHELYDCNWQMFNVLVNLGLRRVGAPWDENRMHACLDRVLGFYLSGGWYSDGPNAHCDYYTAFAIHFYSLIYAKLMEREDPERSAQIKDRAGRFAREFIYWFTADGAALPYGRSLTYRFAQSAFWSSLAFAGVDVFPAGVLKGIVLRNLRWWFRRPIFSCCGVLKVGYAYENQLMSESYNSPGSPYWALKAFLPLALCGGHSFWTAEELPLPPREAVHVQKEPRLVVCSLPESGGVTAFTSGYPYHDGHTHSVPKYEKFAYSTAFGFSVPRGPYGLAQGAYDSTLALSDGRDQFRVKTQSESCEIRGKNIFMTWRPWDDVEVSTCLIPGTPWHVRVHRIRSGRRLFAADGGFAFPVEDGGIRYDDFETEACPDRLLVHSGRAACGAVCLYGAGKAELVHADPDTNLMCPRTVIPTVEWWVDPGESFWVTAQFGKPGALVRGDWEGAPEARLESGRLRLYFRGSLLVTLDLCGTDRENRIDK